MKHANPTVSNPLQALAGLGAPVPSSNSAGVGQYITAAMLAAAAGGCNCETCKLMARAARAMRKGLIEDDDDA